MHQLFGSEQNPKEFLLYFTFGILTFAVNTSTYALFNLSLGINELIANVISWILAVTVAYITNKIWVFRSRHLGQKATFLELIKFYGGRILTLVVEEIILFVFITTMHYGSLRVKVIAQIVVIVLNYLISKLFVFRRKKSE